MAELLTVPECRKAACWTPGAWDYFASGGDALALRKRNRRAWDDIELRPRVLVGVCEVDLAHNILAVNLPFPAMAATRACQRMA